MNASSGDGPKVLVASNCQAQGVADCMKLMCSGLRAEATEYWLLDAALKEGRATFEGYDYVFAVPHFLDVHGSRIPGQAVPLPEVVFDGYHPDQTEVSAGGTRVTAPMGGYHSMLAFECYKRGRSVADTVAAFNRRTYEQVGYFDLWDQSRDRLFALWSSCGYDASRHFYKWVRRPEPFMYAWTHPKIDVLFDLASDALDRTGLRKVHVAERPRDHWALASTYPVYPELAERYGVSGSYRFRIGVEYETIGLQEFVARSFEAYDAHDVDALSSLKVWASGRDALSLEALPA